MVLKNYESELFEMLNKHSAIEIFVELRNYHFGFAVVYLFVRIINIFLFSLT